MAFSNCENRRDCTGIAIVLSIIIGIVAAFLQITAVITITPVFLWVAFGIAIAYLAVTLVAVSLSQRSASCRWICSTLSALLIGILGTIFLALVLLAIEFAATSIIGAIIVGTLLFFFSLILTTTACLVKCLMNYDN